MSLYNDKYLKYKNKYLDLKKQFAGTEESKINHLILSAYKYNFKIRNLSEYEIEIFKSKQAVINKLNHFYGFFTNENELEIINAIKENPSFLKSFFHSKDLIIKPVRFYALINIIEYVITHINVESDIKIKLKYIFFLIEYIIGYQIWSDGNHRTSLFISKKLINHHINKNVGEKFERWYLKNYDLLNDNNHFGKLMTYNQTDDTYDFTFDFDYLLKYPNNNFNYMVELFIEYSSTTQTH